ncbi:MAG: glycosyltransferase family 4 protein [Bacilli bacterium]|nr:glycosyltransferase family 4 protein [Bacilli bacterium]
MSKEIKILHIIDSLGLGGAQTVVKGVFEFQKNNKNIFLFALRNRDILMEVKHANVQIFNSSKKYSFAPLFALRDLIKREEISILHCHLFKSQIFGLLLKKIWFRNIKLIFHEHGEIFENHITYILFMRASRSTINRIIAVSNATKENLTAKAGIKDNKIQVLYNFVDLNKFNKKNVTWNIEAEREKLGIQNNEFAVGFAARLVKRKGWEEFVQSAKLLKIQHPSIKFVIAGNGKDEVELLNFIKKNNLKNNIIFLGYVSDMAKFYSLLDCFVIPSHWEPMGLTEIEAQALSVPVISANVPALNEIIIDNENGFMFEVKNSQDLSMKIELIYKDEKARNKFAKNGLESVIKYDLKNYINNLNKVYEDI